MKTQNCTLEELQKEYVAFCKKEENFREAIKNYISRFLIDNEEDNPYECEITLETKECVGLSTLDMPYISYIYQTNEGFIFFHIFGMGKIEFEELSTEELMIVAKEL